MLQPPEVQASQPDELTLLWELRRAAAKGEFRLAYQPVVDLRDERVVGVEALLRWQHPTRGLVPPGAFLPFAERSGLIMGIGDWVLQEACRQASGWVDALEGARPLTMSVNVSGHQLAAGGGLVESVRRALDQSGLAPANLTLEVMESALVRDAGAAVRAVHSLKDLGVRIAIDNVGTGHSLEVSLKRFPVDLLKVDRSLVAALGATEQDTTVRTVVALAATLGIEAVAEGIETRGQLATLQSFGCAFGQGYLWSPGRPAADLGQSLFQATVDRSARPSL